MEKSEKAKKGVKEIMGGQVLELRSEKDQRIGKEKGFEMLSKLAKLLYEDGRDNEIYKAATDESYRDELLNQYNITF